MQPYISQSASSRVWSTPELARLIILNLKFRVHHDGYTFGLPKNRSALASLARVNTLTSEIALSVLYQRVDDDSGVGPRAAPTLLNLISILGSLKRCETSGWNFEWPLESSGWSRFLRYSRFVKTIRLSPGYPYGRHSNEVKKLVHGIAPDAFLAMHVTRPDAEPIFPSLRCFYTTYHATVDPSNPFYEFVFQSQLVHLQVTSVASVSNLLSYTDRSSNTLQSLHFIERSHNLHSGHYRELLTTIARLTCLTDLHIPSAFVPAVFQTLSSKTNLRHLGITQYPGEAHDEDHRILFPKDGFIHLESFTLQDFSPRPHDHFTIASAHHQLRTLHIELAKIELDDYRNYFMKISLGFPNMERLCIKSYTREHHWDPRNCLPAFGILEPLLALSNIRDFGFHTDIPFSLSDEEIDDIAQAWPQLEEFLFCKDALYTDVEGPELTLWGLISFAEHCPRLRTLTLPISAKIEPDLDPTETPSFNERFSYLNLAFSPIWGFSEELALCLAALLPNGAELTFEEGEGGREREDSHRVEDWCMMRSFVTSVVKERAAGSGDTIEVWESLPDEQDE